MADEQGPGDQYGPFSGALLGPLTPQSTKPTPAYAPSKAGAVALFANKFLTGLQQGRRTAYERSEQTKAEHRENFNTVYAHILKSDQYSPEAKRAAEQVYNQTMGVQINEAVKGADKAHADNPIMALAKSVGQAMAGPGENKKHKDYGDSLNALVAITRDPKFQVNPQEVGALENALKPTQQAQAGGQQPSPAGATPQPAQPPTGGQGGQPPQAWERNLPRVGTNEGTFINPSSEGGKLIPGIIGARQAPGTASLTQSGPVAAAPQSAQPPAAQAGAPSAPAQTPPAGTTPPPGTTAEAATAPKGGVPWTSQQEALADPRFVAAMGKINKAGLQFGNTELGQVFNSLPKASGPKPFGAKYQAKSADGVLHEYQDAVDPATGTITKIDHGEAKTPNPTSTEQKHQALVDAYKLNGFTDEEAKKKVASLDVKNAENTAQITENKTAPKMTPTSQLSANLLTSGKAKTQEEADRQAAQMMVDYQSAKTKAEQHRSTTGGGGVGSLTPQELQGLVTMSIITGQSPAFGNGQSAIRTQYLKGLAQQFSGEEGVGNALSQKTDYKSDSQALVNMTKMKANVGSFEGSASKALDNALAASKNVPRDSSALVNGWDQWLTKHSADDPNLQKLFVYTETAANEYARVIGSLTGASTNDARAQANTFIRAQLAEKSFQGAAEAMKTDMRNRTEQIDQTIKGLRSSIADIAKKPDNAPPPKQDDAVDASVKSIKVGDKDVSIGQFYKGKKIIGFTKDHHLVTE